MSRDTPMKHYFFRLVPPRPSFPGDMTPQEAALMREHSVYWSGLIAQGLVHAVGPVFDPRGAFGMAVASLPDGDDPQALGAADPVVKAGVGFRVEVLPMPSLLLPQKPAAG
jgi:uncharacterized protein YciI